MLSCTITSTKETQEFKELQSVTVPTLSGEAQILYGHAEMFTLLKAGTVILKYSENKEEKQEITEADCYIANNKVTIVI